MEMQSVLDVIILKNSRNEFTKLSSGSKHPSVETLYQYFRNFSLTVWKPVMETQLMTFHREEPNMASSLLYPRGEINPQPVHYRLLCPH